MTPPEETRPLLPRRYLPLLIILLLSGFLSLFVEGFFTRFIFLPIIQFFAYYYRLYQILPQNLVWGGLVVYAALVMLRLLWPRFARPPATAVADTPRSRLQQLAEMYAQARKSDYARWELAREVEKLALLSLQRQHGQTAVAIQQRIASQTLPLPPALQAVFAVNRAIPDYRSFIAARQAARRKPIPALATLDLDAALAEMVAWEAGEMKDAG